MSTSTVATDMNEIKDVVVPNDITIEKCGDFVHISYFSGKIEERSGGIEVKLALTQDSGIVIYKTTKVHLINMRDDEVEYVVHHNSKNRVIRFKQPSSI